MPADTPPRTRANSMLLRLPAGLLCLGVAVIHVIDQGGVPGTKDPSYVQGLYYALEVGGILTALVLLVPRFPLRWPLAAAVALGPIIGYVLSRGPGLPSYTDDVGNWGETLGVISLIVEAALLVVSLTAMGLARRTTGARRAPATGTTRRPPVGARRAAQM